MTGQSFIIAYALIGLVIGTAATCLRRRFSAESPLLIFAGFTCFWPAILPAWAFFALLDRLRRHH